MRILTVTVYPEAVRANVKELGEDRFSVAVTEPSLKGKANKAMCKELARYLKVPVSNLIVSQGDRSNEKTVILTEEL